MTKKRKALLLLLLLYLIFDLRPLLLIPNLILYRKPCARYADGNGAIEMHVFPRLCVAGDPIRAVITSHDLPLGDAFARTYDRSGLFSEFQFSGQVNDVTPVETLYWTCGMGGGLGSFTVIPEKKIWLGDYVHFDRIGRYGLNLRYQDSIFSTNSSSTRVDYELSDFSIIYLPENPFSKFLKELILGAGLYVPSDDIRQIAVKLLGYQETRISTYALAKYRAKYDDEWRSTDHPYVHSLFETRRGILRNYDFCSVRRILRRFKQQSPNSVLADYFESHCTRLIWSGTFTGYNGPTADAKNDLAQLVSCTYAYLDEASKTSVRKTLARTREMATDEFWQTKLSKYEHEQATNETHAARIDRGKNYASARLAEKKDRDSRLRLIDYTTTLLDEQERQAASR